MSTTDAAQLYKDAAQLYKDAAQLYKNQARKPTSTGWKCPSCGRVNSPSVMECPCSPVSQPVGSPLPHEWRPDWWYQPWYDGTVTVTY